jgi:hypothetical protein
MHLLGLIRSRGVRYRRQPSASRNAEQLLKQVQTDSNETAEENADRRKRDLEEGAEEEIPPRVLILGVGPVCFSAIFSGGGQRRRRRGDGLLGLRYGNGGPVLSGTVVDP